VRRSILFVPASGISGRNHTRIGTSERLDRRFARCRTGSRQDKGNRLFELQLVVDRHYHRLVDVRVPFLAAADEHVVAPTHEIREAVAIAAEHVTGDVKAVAGQRFCGHFGQVVVPAH
jgi:hypothetical protein